METRMAGVARRPTGCNRKRVSNEEGRSHSWEGAGSPGRSMGPADALPTTNHQRMPRVPPPPRNAPDPRSETSVATCSRREVARASREEVCSNEG
jgi:hypothetical protein